ncbi:MAG: stage III sporulation protein AB [Oscillospiraceae bacterium]|nr:stage III sporulation protein AB [Oscillospiraceae bacterium]
MLKAAGLLCIIVCGAGLGAAASLTLRRRIVVCIALRYFLQELGIMMRCTGDTLSALISGLAHSESCAALPFLAETEKQLEEGVPFPEAWKGSVSKAAGITSEMKELLLSLGECLGTSDLAGQLMNLERAGQQLDVIYEKALEQHRTKGKLYRCLGVLGGMSAALLLC